MEKVILSIFDCKPGMKIAETIYNNYGAVMIGEDTILDKQALERIENMGLSEIRVFSQALEEIQGNHIENVQARYRQNLQEVKDIITKVGGGAPLKMADVRNVTDNILAGTYSVRDLTGVLADIGGVEEYEYTHSLNVSLLAVAIGKWMNCSEKTIRHLAQAGLLHDIGKSKIPKEILHKPGELTDKEFKTMKQHPVHSYSLLKSVPTIHEDVLYGILTHHEREDGSGYPSGITSEKISLIAKILAVADIYDAMTSERIYRKDQSPFEVFELMQNGSFGQLHPTILNKFIKNMGTYYKGKHVLLNNGEQGEVIFINASSIARPIVQVGDRYVDLSHERSLKIESVLKDNMGMDEIDLNEIGM